MGIWHHVRNVGGGAIHLSHTSKKNKPKSLMCLLICYEIDSEGQGTSSISSWQLRNETSKKKFKNQLTFTFFSSCAGTKQVAIYSFVKYYLGFNKQYVKRKLELQFLIANSLEKRWWCHSSEEEYRFFMQDFRVDKVSPRTAKTMLLLNTRQLNVVTRRVLFILESRKVFLNGMCVCWVPF